MTYKRNNNNVGIFSSFVLCHHNEIGCFPRSRGGGKEGGGTSDCRGFLESAKARPRAAVRSLSEELNTFPERLPAERRDTAECGKYSVISALAPPPPVSRSALRGEMDRRVRPLGAAVTYSTFCIAAIRPLSPPLPPSPLVFKPVLTLLKGSGGRLCVCVSECACLVRRGGKGC